MKVATTLLLVLCAVAAVAACAGTPGVPSIYVPRDTPLPPLGSGPPVIDWSPAEVDEQGNPIPPGVVYSAPTPAQTAATSAAPTASTIPEPTAVVTPEPTAVESASPVPSQDAGDLPFIGTWQVTGYRIGADGSRYLWEGGKMKMTVDILSDGSFISHTETRDVNEQWVLAGAGQIKIIGEGGSQVVKYRTDGGKLLFGNTDGSWSELVRIS